MIKHDDGSVTLTKSEYDTLMAEYKKLVNRDDWLSCLEAAGVDNWSGYDDAREMQREDADEED